MNELLPWYWRALPLDNKTGSEVFEQLFSQERIATLLESPIFSSGVGDSLAVRHRSSLSRYSICAGAPRVVAGTPQLWTPKIGEIFAFLRSLLQREDTGDNCPEKLPFTGGWLGWLGYDVAWESERLPTLNKDPLPFPVAYWYEPAAFAVLDHWQQQLWLAASQPDDLDRLQTQLELKPSLALRVPSKLPAPHTSFSFLCDQNEYEEIVRRAKKYIQMGEIFQANLSIRFQTATNADSWRIYRTLQAINPSPFASYWRSPWGAIISCSPERLIQLQGDLAQTRPIAGTRPRGATKALEAQLIRELRSDLKERAEHIMLVDLERNDLGRVCQWGSVAVDELLAIERYSHVIHLVSNVKGRLRRDRDAIDLIRALSPGGTITGCPKIRCMEIIEELEPVRRNLFYGSCGYLDRRGNLDLNILIRTLLYQAASSSLAATVWGQVGAGIVADSDPEREWYESLHKAEAQIAALQMVNSDNVSR
jgi:para-aminobenzoate synthetase component I